MTQADEVHKAGANSYQKIVNYFNPKFLLGMTATPERSDDFDIFKMFNYNIAYEIRLQQALEEDLLCPFHYFGVSDVTIDGIELDDKTDFNDIKLIKESYFNLKQKIGRIPSLSDFEEFDSIDPLRIFATKLGSYYNFLKKYDSEYTVELNDLEALFIEFISKKLASGKRPQELIMIKNIVHNKEDLIGELKYELKKIYNIDFKETTATNVINILTNEFPTGSAKKTYSKCVFVERQDNYYVISSELKKCIENDCFKGIVMELIDFGLSRYNKNYSNRYMNTNFQLYQKYTYEDVCRLLEWEKGEVALNIGGYKYDKTTKTYPVFINYDKSDYTEDTINYEDRFESESQLIAISKSGRTITSEDIVTS